MKTTRYVLGALVVVLLAAAFAPLPAGQQNLAANSATLNDPTQSFMEAALGLPFLAPMTLSASAPIVSVALETETTPDYACRLVSQSPANWTKMSGRQDFDAKWTLLNTGLKTWSTSVTDYKYLSGTKMHTRADIYDLRVNVATGKKVSIVVDMMAPKYNGSYSWYTETWGLARSNRVFCRFSVTIVVNR